MRKLIVSTFITLDGVMQAPGGPDEDPSGGFEFGGWIAPYDKDLDNDLMQKQMKPADLLLGRKTFEIFAGFWPQHEEGWPGINDVNKYVMSNSMEDTDPKVTGWNNSFVLKSVDDIKKLKSEKYTGKFTPDIQVWGSGNLVQTLLQHDLVDEFWLKIFPLTLGKGKKLFQNGAIPAAFTLKESLVTSKGMIMANYARAGEVLTGTVGA